MRVKKYVGVESNGRYVSRTCNPSQGGGEFVSGAAKS